MVDEEKRKGDVWWDVREPKRESQEHRSNSKSPGERKRFRMQQVCAGARTCLQMLSKYTSARYMYTNTQLPHITEQSERGGERELVRTNSIGRQHAAPAFVYQTTRLSCLLFDSSFKVGGAASWGLHARVNRNHAQSTSSHNDCKSRTDVNVRPPDVVQCKRKLLRSY